MGRFVRHAFAVLAAALLAGCSSFSGPGKADARALDYLNDDVAGLVLAFDMPETLEPAPEGSLLAFDAATPGGGERHIRATLIRADASEVAASFPPPQRGRIYHLFAFSDSDKAALREAQAWARTLAPGEIQRGSVSISIEPRFCAVGEVDPGRESFSVLAALPGVPALRPLVAGQLMAAALAQSGSSAVIPPCEGHSG